MRERLIELLMQGELNADKKGFFNCSQSKQKAEIIADYLLSKGVIVPRCKVGDAVYCINRKIFHNYIKCITITTKGLSYVTYWDSTYHDEDFDEVIFLSEEEAEKALKESEQNA